MRRLTVVSVFGIAALTMLTVAVLMPRQAMAPAVDDATDAVPNDDTDIKPESLPVTDEVVLQEAAWRWDLTDLTYNGSCTGIEGFQTRDDLTLEVNQTPVNEHTYALEITGGDLGDTLESRGQVSVTEETRDHSFTLFAGPYRFYGIYLLRDASTAEGTFFGESSNGQCQYEGMFAGEKR